ncbi:unnamed protein product, partial [Arabidopsis halleri]
ESLVFIWKVNISLIFIWKVNISLIFISFRHELRI